MYCTFFYFSVSNKTKKVFRFGQSIAHVANTIVGILKRETRPLLGCAAREGQVGWVKENASIAMVLLREGDRPQITLSGRFATPLQYNYRRRGRELTLPSAGGGREGGC